MKDFFIKNRPMYRQFFPLLVAIALQQLIGLAVNLLDNFISVLTTTLHEMDHAYACLSNQMILAVYREDPSLLNLRSIRADAELRFAEGEHFSEYNGSKGPWITQPMEHHALEYEVRRILDFYQPNLGYSEEEVREELFYSSLFVP